MISDEDPTPLDALGGQAPESLVRALRALGREQPSAAALHAAALRLEARLDAAPPVAIADQPTGTKVLASRLALAALAIGVGVGTTLVLRQPAQPAPQATYAQPAAAAPSPARLDTPRPAAPERLPAPPEERPTSVSTPAPVAARAVAVEPEHAVRPAANAPAKRALRAGNGERVDGAHKAQASAPTPVGTPASHAATTTSSESTQQVPRPAVPRSELELLLAARKEARVDPSSALGTLAEHARRFPAGQLAPEREVLAIEALRALGMNKQAEERLSRFRAAYPNSVHTPALAAPAR